MADEDKDQKTEPATPKRRAEAFKRGQFARSPDVQVAFTLTAALVVMLFSLPDIARALRDFGIYSLLRGLELKVMVLRQKSYIKSQSAQPGIRVVLAQ